MSNVQAITVDIKFEARIASFFELHDDTKKELLEALSKAVYDTGKKHDFLTWRVQLLNEGKK